MKTARDNMNITTDNTRLTLSFYKHGEVNMYLHNDTGGGIIQSWTVAPANLFRAIVLTMTWPTFMISDYYRDMTLSRYQQNAPIRYYNHNTSEDGLLAGTDRKT
jgi:hypothetical protein